jgi:hypothetical protein
VRAPFAFEHTAAGARLAERNSFHGSGPGSGGTDDERITYAFRTCLSRTPDAEELAELKALLKKQKQYIAEGWVNPSELGAGRIEPPKKLPKKTTPTELAAYTVVARVLLNLDETITRE